ncbi:RNA polymerase sigma factor SigJ [Nocardia cyriacigeorgica]|uniref:RNA polymerase sigma factor SigJ n=1 Tax=Nocardia cyriacigeorgica TaxID=135487 RepID=UPI0013D059C1|nr:RNA polymerase sigma factor SigJ [Nocardia cyriacigeorgica]NEW29698.1 sigma-70 family RNA polymerase sigma factor [Nocardia cyriacigeorgica]
MAVGVREVAVFEDFRPRLEAIAYRLLGSAGDAEDAVQDTFVRWHAADHDAVETPQAWLTKVLTNICLNQLTSARARREAYVGQWLPEPVLAGDRMAGPADTVEQRESVSIAMLTLMEKLSARERVVYVLREAFGYPHSEIAEILEITEANCTQIYRRAKQHLVNGKTRREVDEIAARKVVEEFLTASLSGDIDALVRMLADDAISIGDGGGIVFSLPEPVTGALRVARFLRRLFEPSEGKWAMIGGRADIFAGMANGMPALVITVGERIVGIISLELTTDGIASVHTQGNPAKLERATRHWAAAGHAEPLTQGW